MHDIIFGWDFWGIGRGGVGLCGVGLVGVFEDSNAMEGRITLDVFRNVVSE